MLGRFKLGDELIDMLVVEAKYYGCIEDGYFILYDDH